ncbi:MAG: hypothetical protein QHH15_05440 [Candidatus Thermoplasmatota archaeon]|jgi:DNA-binding CsgD family transcriptional regulator|nr:hypothetical protein [Candidatus Thermoplasmatota archaeon]
MMPAKLSDEKIVKIRREIRNGKSRRLLSREMALSVDTVCKYGKYMTTGNINQELKNIIRKEVKSGKSKRQIAFNYGLSRHCICEITEDIKSKGCKISNEELKKIREEVKKGKTKKQVAIEMNRSITTVEDYTKDIRSGYYLSDYKIKKIIKLKKAGKTFKEIAFELQIHKDTVRNHLKDYQYRYCRYTEVPISVIQEIRRQVKNGKNNQQVSDDLCVAYSKVKLFTADLPGGSIYQYYNKKLLPKRTIQQIIKEVREGKSKMQVSRERGLSPETVYYHTKDIITGYVHDSQLSGKTYELLQEILKNGYALPSKKYTFKNYQKLYLKFPNIVRVKIFGRVIYFLEDKTGLACRKFLKSFSKRITNYNELKRVIDVFKTYMKKEEKEKYIKRGKSKNKEN